MTKEEDQAFSEANSMGEERCGDCGLGVKKDAHYFDIWCVKLRIMSNRNHTGCTYFTPNRGSSLGETKHAKEEE